jgi:hypothetical protein
VEQRLALRRFERPVPNDLWQNDATMSPWLRRLQALPRSRLRVAFRGHQQCVR